MKKVILQVITAMFLLLAACRVNETMNPKETGVETNTGSLSGYGGITPTVTPAETSDNKTVNIEPKDSAGIAENNGENTGKHPAENPGDKYRTGKYTGPAVEGVKSEMLTAAFWVNLYKGSDEVIMTREQIKAYNDMNFKNLSFLYDFEILPETVTGRELLEWINKLSVVPNSDRYDENGKKYLQRDYQQLKENLNTDKIAGILNVRYGIAVKRTQLRTWPSYKQSFSGAADRRIDYFTETAVYAAEPLLIYHESSDGQWYFAHIYNYKGWIPAKDVALCSKEVLEDYLAAGNFLVVKGPAVFTPESNDGRVSRLQLDMGVKLRILSENPAGYTVNYHVCNDDGSLDFSGLTIPLSEDVSAGYLDYTVENVLIQAFKLLGEPYGWGGMNNARDCASFVADVYRSFGILLPRNSDQQEKVSGSVSFSGKNRDERLEILDSLRPGSLLYMPGHAMMYLGKWKDRYYIIHDVATVYKKENNGRLTPVKLYQVSVTPMDVCNSKGTEYIMLLTTAVEIK